jgi:NodT family efflux transporter outer membrane factor (OMF) lipoprotein
MRGGQSIFVLSVAMLLVAGCTPWREYKANGCKVGPNYSPPHADVAEHWIDANDKRLSSGEPDLRQWWTAFNDPKLDELIHASVNQNLSLREACFRILEARANLAIQMGNLFPQTQQAFAAYSRNAASALAANQGLLATNLFGSRRFFDDWNLGFNLSWELDFWGRFRRAIESAADDLDASVFNYDDVLVTLLGDVASTYVQIRTIQQQLEYVRDNIKIQNESLDIAQARFRGGLSSELDVEQAISQLAQTEALLPQFEKQLRFANDRLCVLLGIPTEDLMQVLGEQSIPTASPDVVVGIPCDLLTRRPDVRRAERQAAAQCAQIGIAEAELYPHISITGSVGYDAERFADLFKSKSFQATVGPGLQWNVLNYGRLVNNIRLQYATFCQLVTTYRNTVLKANSEAEDGIAEFLQSQLQAKALRRSVTAADKAVQLAITQYRAGLVDFNRVALLEQNLVQQQDLLAQAQGDIAQGLVHTYRALGGGWEVNCESNGVSIATGEAAGNEVNPSAEELPPGRKTPGPTPTAPSQPQVPGPRNSPLPGPADDLQPTTGAPGQQRSVQVTEVRLPARGSDKPMRLRYADEQRESLQHAGLLPEDRGETKLVR